MESAVKILIADDDEFWLEQARLAVPGHDVTLARSGHEAYLRIKDDRFDLLILDNTMPGHNEGVNLLKALRMQGNKTPVIIHSADLPYMAQEDVKKHNGVYVRKSSDGVALTQAVQKTVVPR